MRCRVTWVAKEPRVIFDEADRPPDAESLERLRGPPGEHDGNAFADPVHVDGELPLEPHAEGQQHDDGDGPPDDPEDREEGAQLLRPEVADEFAVLLLMIPWKHNEDA